MVNPINSNTHNINPDKVNKLQRGQTPRHPFSDEILQINEAINDLNLFTHHNIKPQLAPIIENLKIAKHNLFIYDEENRNEQLIIHAKNKLTEVLKDLADPKLDVGVKQSFPLTLDGPNGHTQRALNGVKRSLPPEIRSMRSSVRALKGAL